MKRAAALIAVALTACGTPPSAIRPDSNTAEYQIDAAQCDYESSAATAGYGSGQNTARTNSGAASQGFATGMAQGMARNDLFVKCMRAKYAARSEATFRANLQPAQPTIPYEGKVMFPPPAK